MYVDLIQNTSLIVALTALYSLISRLNRYGETWGKILSGLLFGGVAMVGMQLPLHYAPGVIYDGRSIILAMAGLFGGGTAAVVSTVLAGAYRAHMGGAGVWAGLGTIIGCAGVGLAFRRGYGNRPDRIGILSLYGFGISVHVVMLACQLLIQPWPSGLAVINRIWLPIFLIFPTVTVLMGLFLGTEERRIQTERSLRDSEEKYRGVVENANEGITVTQDGKLKFVNRKALEVSGYSETEMMPMPFVEFIHPDDRQEVMQHHLKRLKGEEISKVYVLRIISKDGAIRWLENNGVCISWEGKPATLSLLTDITGRKKTEEALRLSESKLRATLDAVPFPMAVVDLQDDNIFFWSRSALALFGHTAPTSSEWYQIAYPDPEYRREVIGRWKPFLEIARESGQPVNTGEYRVTCRDGSVRICELYATFLPDNLVVIFNDITERKQADHEKEKLLAQLIQAQKMEAIGTLAGGIAHDFNNILSAVIGYTELAQMKLEADSEIKDDLNEVLAASVRAKDLVNQILEFSRQSQKEQMPVQMRLIVKEALKLIRSSLPTTIDIRQNIQSQSIVLIDPTQLHQIVMNLCANAAHAMREKGGILEVVLTDVELDSDFCSFHAEIQPGAYQKLTVSDTGHGMTADVMNRIFDPFFTTKPKNEGTGLGLSVVHGIAKDSGGMITVYSELDKGTTFNLYFPIIKGRAEEKPEEHTIISTGTERILVVDDEKAIIDITKKHLTSLGYAVEVRTSSLEALELFKAMPDKFDLVITDMTMPQMTGDMLARELMKIRPDLPVILCTGFSENITKKKAKTMGIKAFLMKPLLKKEMAHKIRKVLDEAKGTTQQ